MDCVKNQKSKRIGFDFDEVLMNFCDPLRLYSNNIDRTNLQGEHYTSYDLSKTWKCTPEEATKRVIDFYYSEHHFNALPVEGAVEGIKILKEDYDLFVITSRPEKIREITTDWLDKYFPNMFEEIHLTNLFYSEGENKICSKKEVCLELGLEAFVDDALHYAYDVSSAGIPVLLYNTPRNQGMVEPPIMRVHSWQDIVDKLRNENLKK